MDLAVAGDQESGAALGSLDLVGDVARRVDTTVGEQLHVRGLHDAVANRHRADLEWAEEVRVLLAHGVLRGLGASEERLA